VAASTLVYAGRAKTLGWRGGSDYKGQGGNLGVQARDQDVAREAVGSVGLGCVSGSIRRWGMTMRAHMAATENGDDGAGWLGQLGCGLLDWKEGARGKSKGV
jgi:hypothetical protein